MTHTVVSFDPAVYHAAVKTFCETMGIDVNKASSVTLQPRSFSASGATPGHGAYSVSGIAQVQPTPAQTPTVPIPLATPDAPSKTRPARQVRRAGKP